MLIQNNARKKETTRANGVITKQPTLTMNTFHINNNLTDIRQTEPDYSNQ